MQSRFPRGCYLAASWGLPWQVSGESGAGPGMEPTHCTWVMGILTTSLLPNQLHFKMRLIYLESRKRESDLPFAGSLAKCLLQPCNPLTGVKAESRSQSGSHVDGRDPRS